MFEHAINQQCVEICRGDKLLGYAIWFSGGWDCYRRDERGRLVQVASNVAGREEAVGMVVEGKSP